MSESFFNFTVKCPNCGMVNHQADGFETDDWFEVFVFSGFSRKSSDYYHGYTCPNCKETFDIDFLFDKKLITPASIEDVKSYFYRVLPHVIEKKGLSDHGWNPDVEAAVRRYASLFPNDKEFQLLLKLYYFAYHYPRKLIKFEPPLGTSVITRDMIVYPKTLQKVYLPDGLIEIGNHAFFECSSLKDIFLPKTVNKIGASAFANCTALSSIHTSDNLVIIEDSAFLGCISLTSFFFPEGVKEIGNRCFFQCKRLKKVYIPMGCDIIGQDAFANCPDIIFHGKQGTVAERYAKENGFTFVAD